MASIAPDTFVTPRLSAQRLAKSHLGALVSMMADKKGMASLGGVRSAEQTAAYLETNLTHWEQHGFGMWMLHLREDDAFIGRAGLRRLTLEGVDEVEVAYALRNEFWNRGLATEVVVELVRLGLERLQRGALIGTTSSTNVASQHVLEKAGFRYERTVIKKGHHRLLFRITAPG